MENAGKKNSQQLMKAYNENLVYNSIRLYGPISRATIARMTKMSATSIGRIVENLIDENMVSETGTVSGMVGRKPTMLQVNPEGMLAIAVGIDYAKIEAGVVDICGKINHSEVYRSKNGMSQEEIIGQIRLQIQRVLDILTPEQRRRVVGIGITTPGVVRFPERVVTSPKFRWQKVPLGELCGEYGIDLMVENAVKAAATAEHMFGCTKNINSYVMITMVSGIGAAIMLNGELFRGSNNIAGEIGHITVDPNGILCDCGRRGCLQSTLCMLGLERKTGLPYNEIIFRAETGEELYCALMDNVVEQLSQWVANMANLYDFPTIILYGEMLEDHYDIYRQITERYQKYLWTSTRKHLEIIKSEINLKKLPLLSAAAVAFCKVLASEVVIR